MRKVLIFGIFFLPTFPKNAYGLHYTVTGSMEMELTVTTHQLGQVDKSETKSKKHNFETKIDSQGNLSSDVPSSSHLLWYLIEELKQSIDSQSFAKRLKDVRERYSNLEDLAKVRLQEELEKEQLSNVVLERELHIALVVSALLGSILVVLLVGSFIRWIRKRNQQKGNGLWASLKRKFTKARS